MYVLLSGEISESWAKLVNEQSSPPIQVYRDGECIGVHLLGGDSSWDRVYTAETDCRCGVLAF